MFVGRIYKIRTKHHPKVYIGSTRKLLATRFAEHCAEYEKYKKGEASYVTSFDLIEAGGADVNHRREDGTTALFVAAFRGHDSIASTLIEAGADLFLESKSMHVLFAAVGKSRPSSPLL